MVDRAGRREVKNPVSRDAVAERMGLTRSATASRLTGSAFLFFFFAFSRKYA